MNRIGLQGVQGYAGQVVVLVGKGDRMFFGLVRADQSRIESWPLLDRKAFRGGLKRQVQTGGSIEHGDQTNLNKTSVKWFDVRPFPASPPLVAAGFVKCPVKEAELIVMIYRGHRTREAAGCHVCTICS